MTVRADRTVRTNGISRSEWLKCRKVAIGGSEAAAIVGMNEYATPYSVWAGKLGYAKPVEDNEAMRQGRDLEEYVAKRFCEETGKKVRRRNAILFNDTYPFALANIDRDVIGENAGLECKTTSSLNLRRFKNGDFPDTYYWQCMHYMMVTGADRWYLAVLVFGKEFFIFTLERDEEDIAFLAGEERAFWRYVENEEAPPVDGLKPTTDAINAVYPIPHNNEELDLYDKSEYLTQRDYLNRQIKTLTASRDMIDQQLKEAIGDCEYAESAMHKISWKAYTKRTFDAKRFQADHPNLDLDKYYNISEFRKFLVKEKKHE